MFSFFLSFFLFIDFFGVFFRALQTACTKQDKWWKKTYTSQPTNYMWPITVGIYTISSYVVCCVRVCSAHDTIAVHRCPKKKYQSNKSKANGCKFILCPWFQSMAHKWQTKSILTPCNKHPKKMAEKFTFTREILACGWLNRFVWCASVVCTFTLCCKFFSLLSVIPRSVHIFILKN